MKAVRYCLLKGKESFLDHHRSIREYGCCWWKQSHKLNVGDICYLYLTEDQVSVIDECFKNQ